MAVFADQISVLLIILTSEKNYSSCLYILVRALVYIDYSDHTYIIRILNNLDKSGYIIHMWCLFL